MFGLVWLGLLDGCLYGGRIQESWYCSFVLPETLHSPQAFHLPRSDITGLPLTNLPNWITHWICPSASSHLEHRPLSASLANPVTASVTHPEALSKPKAVVCLDARQREAARPQAPALEQSARSTW